MIMQNILLPEWDWEIAVFYDAKEKDAESILLFLQLTGCAGRSLDRAEKNLRSGILDCGLTYSNGRSGQTVMVIGEASSPAEFWDTIGHETGHVTQHIAERLHIDHRGEEYQYITGEICRQMYPVAKMFICGKCK